MAILRNSGQGGTDGLAVTTANSGGDSGDAWAVVTKGAGSAIDFDTAQAAHGTVGYLITPASGQVTEFRQNFTDAFQLLVSFYMRIPSAFTVTSSIVQIRNAAGTIANLNLTTTRRIQVVDDANATVFTSASGTPMATNTWYRIELRVVPGTTTSNGTIQFAYYVGDSTVAVETFSDTTSNTGTDPITNCRFGRTSGATADVTAHWMDSFQMASDADGSSLVLVWPAVSDTLVVDDSLQAQVADEVALTQTHFLVVQDALHTHSAESPTLTGTHVLVVNDAIHTHVADNVTLQVIQPLSGPATVSDRIGEKLQAEYPTLTEKNAGALLQKFRDDNNVEEWEDYLALLFGVSTVDTAGDAAKQYWDAYTPTP